MHNNFDYESDMKNYYKSDAIAKRYFDKYKTNSDWRERIIANRERKAVASLLCHINHQKILDIPTGTGKLAPVLAKTNASILACDISANMLKIAKIEYKQATHSNVRFQLQDAESLSGIEETFDVAVCLRLLHRVPTDVKRRILHELGMVAKFIIVSTGIETKYHKVRRNIRKRLLGDDNRGNCYENTDVTHAIFRDGFKIIDSMFVLPFLSQEKIFLLKSDRN